MVGEYEVWNKANGVTCCFSNCSAFILTMRYMTHLNDQASLYLKELILSYCLTKTLTETVVSTVSEGRMVSYQALLLWNQFILGPGGRQIFLFDDAYSQLAGEACLGPPMDVS